MSIGDLMATDISVPAVIYLLEEWRMEMRLVEVSLRRIAALHVQRCYWFVVVAIKLENAFKLLGNIYLTACVSSKKSAAHKIVFEVLVRR